MKIERNKKSMEFDRLFKEINEKYSELASVIGFSESSFVILYALLELGNGCLQKDIVNQYYLNKQTINSAVKSLEKNGYIYLEKGRGRNMHIYLTAMGEKFAQEKIIPVIEAEDRVFERMTEEEGQLFLELNRKYNEIFIDEINKLKEIL